jgi:hypothetical protein
MDKRGNTELWKELVYGDARNFGAILSLFS